MINIKVYPIPPQVSVSLAGRTVVIEKETGFNPDDLYIYDGGDVYGYKTESSLK